MFQTMLLRPSSTGLWRVVLQRLTSTKASSQQLAEAVPGEARPATKIPGPRAFPIVGSLPSIMTDKNFDSKRFHKYWASLMERYGPIVRLVNPGLGAVVGVANPEDCEKLNRASTDQPQRTTITSLKHLRDNWTDNYFEKRSGIITENGDEWWRVRSRVQTAMMKPMLVREYLPEMDDVALTFMNRIQELQDKFGQMPDNFQEELYKWALESVGVVALDRRLGCLGAPPGSEAARRGEELINVVNNFFSSIAALEMKTRVWHIFPSVFPTYRKLRDNHTKLLQIVTEQVAETVALLQEGKAESDMQLPGDRQHSILTKLLSTQGLSQKDVLTFIMDIVFAGIDTTSHTMAFCLYLLAKNPEVQRKLQKEVDEVVGDLQGSLTPQHMARLSYAKAIIKETFRVFPLTFSFARILTEDLVLQGYRIPAGVSVPLALVYTILGQVWFRSMVPKLCSGTDRVNRITVPPILPGKLNALTEYLRGHPRGSLPHHTQSPAQATMNPLPLAAPATSDPHVPKPSFEWAKCLTLQLIELYRDRPCLTKVKCDLYRNRNEKCKTYEELYSHVKNVDPKCTMDIVKEKINTLRSQYRQELKNGNGKESGASVDDVYTSNLWCFSQLGFLDEGETQREARSTMEPVENNVKDAAEHGDITRPTAAPDVGDNVRTSSAPRSSAPASQPTMKRRTVDTAKRTKEYALNEHHAMSSSLADRGDDAYCMGTVVKMELRSMDAKQRCIAKKLISDVLFYGNLKMLCPASRIKYQQQESESIDTSQQETQHSWRR